MSHAATGSFADWQSCGSANMQTNCVVPARIAIQLKVMRAILPMLCSILRSWTVLPSGL
jgi:hypothetical protein